MRPLYSFSLVDRGTKLITKGSIRCDIKIVGPQTKLSAPYKKKLSETHPYKNLPFSKEFRYNNENVKIKNLFETFLRRKFNIDMR